MNVRFVVLAVAALGWLAASLVAFVFVATCTFAGIGVIGLLIWFICTRIELEKDAVSSGWSPHLIASQFEARQKMSQSERERDRAEQSLALQPVRFFRHLGMALTAIGAVGFLWFQH